MRKESKKILERIKKSLKKGKKVELIDNDDYKNGNSKKVEYSLIINGKEEYNLLNFSLEEALDIEREILAEIRDLEDDAFNKVLRDLGFEYDFLGVMKDGLINKYSRDDEYEDFILSTKNGKVSVNRFFEELCQEYTRGQIRTWCFKLPSLNAIEKRVQDAIEAKKKGKQKKLEI